MKPGTSGTPSAQDDLFAAQPKYPDGFMYREEVISIADERDLLARFETLPFKQFDFHGFLGKRRVVSFGWRYDFVARVLRQSDPMPEFLMPVRQAAAEFAGVPPDSLKQILINQYEAGAGIGWHRDKDMFEHVVAVSLSAPAVLRFRRKFDGVWQRQTCITQPRSAYLLNGQSRWEWEHSISPVDQCRYSITFRDLRKTQQGQE